MSTQRGKVTRFFRRVMWFVLWLIPLFLVCFLLFLTYVRRVELTSVVIEGNVLLTAREVKTYMGINMPVAYLSVNTAEVSKKLEEHPLIYSAAVKKKFDGRLVLALTRSMPLIAILSTVDGVPTPVYFDKTGKCVQVGARGGIVDVPILSGIALVDPHVGVYLPSWARDFVGNLATIKKEHSALFHSVSEFKIHSKGDGYRILELWFVDFQQKYITELDIDAKHLQRLWYLADRINKEAFAQDFESFDVRQGSIIAKKKRAI